MALDDSDFQLAYDRAQNELIPGHPSKQTANCGQFQSQSASVVAQSRFGPCASRFGRRESLAGTEAVSGEELSHARAAVVQAQAALKAVEAEEVSARAALGRNIPLRQQPAVQTAISHIKDAWLNFATYANPFAD